GERQHLAHIAPRIDHERLAALLTGDEIAGLGQVLVIQAFEKHDVLLPPTRAARGRSFESRSGSWEAARRSSGVNGLVMRHSGGVSRAHADGARERGAREGGGGGGRRSRRTSGAQGPCWGGSRPAPAARPAGPA